MSFEMSPFESSPSKRVTLEDLLSETPVSGIGYERFTSQQRADALALLSQIGIEFDDTILTGMPGEAIFDFISYVQTRPGTPERTELAIRIKQAYGEALDNFYK